MGPERTRFCFFGDFERDDIDAPGVPISAVRSLRIKDTGI